MSELSKTIISPRGVTAASSCAKSPTRSTDSSSKGIDPEATAATTLVADAACDTAVFVSGIDLTQYVQPLNEDTPFERFLKDENRLQRLATLPWVCRVHKL